MIYILQLFVVLLYLSDIVDVMYRYVRGTWFVVIRSANVTSRNSATGFPDRCVLSRCY